MQVQDDPDLLDLMWKDTQSAPDLYKPTNYWIWHEKRLLPRLLQYGLRDFRRSNFETFVSMGASDRDPAFEPHLKEKPVRKKSRPE